MSDTTMPDAMATLRSKYPQYNSIPDDQLATKIIAKYPQYQTALGKYVKPTGDFTANLTQAPSIASADSDPAIPHDSQTKGVLSSAMTAGADGAQPDYRSAIDEFKDKYFNTFNETANAPMIVAQGLAKNPNDRALIASLNGMQSPIAKQAIREKAQELRSTGNMHVQGFVPMATPPVFTNPDTGEIAKPSTIGDVAAALIHGPEGANQLATRPGAAAEIERFALHSADPESLAFLAVAGAIGGMGKIGSAAVKGGIGLMMGSAAVDKAKKGDIGGAVVDAGLAALPFAEHPLSEAVGRVKSKLNNKALDAAQTNPTGRFAPDTPYQIPEINRIDHLLYGDDLKRVRMSYTMALDEGDSVAAARYKQMIDQHMIAAKAAEVKPALSADTIPKGEPAAPLPVAAEVKTSKQAVQGEANVPTGNPGPPVSDASGTGPPEQAVGVRTNTGAAGGEPLATDLRGDSSATDGKKVPTDRSSQEQPPLDTVKPDGIRAANEETAARRAEKNLPELPGYTAKTSEEVYQEVRDRGQSADALNVADDVIKNKRAMTAHEIAANVIKQNEIEGQQDTLYSQIKEAAKAGTPHDTLLADYDALDQHYQKLTDATKYSGAEQSLAFRIRDYEINRYGRQQVLKRLALSNPEVPLSAADQDLVRSLTSEHGTLQEGLDKANAAVEAQHATADETASQKAAEQAVEGMKTKAQRAGRQVVRAEQKVQLDQEHDEIVKRLVKATSQANALVDPSILPIIRDLAKNRVKAGLLTVTDVADAVHAAVEPHLPGITKREVRDAISGHGYGSKIPPPTRLGDLKEQMRLMSQIEDVKNKVQAGTRTPRVVSDEVKALRQQKSEALTEGKPSRPRKQMTAERQLEGYKKQLSAKIDDLTRRINDKDFTAKTRSKLLLDPEATELKAQRDALQKVYDSLDPSKTPEARSQKAREREAATRLERLTKEFNEMKAANAKGKYGTPNEPARPDTPEEAAMRHQLDAARTERDAMRAAQRETPHADPLKAYKNRLATQIADMQTHIDSGLADRATGGKTKQLDEEAKILRDQRDQMKEAVNRKRAEIDRVIEARKGKSFLDKYAIYHRAAILSRLTTLAKLSSAGLQRLIFTPAEEGAGAAMHVIPGYGKIAKMAPHGTPSFAAEGAALRSVADYKANYADSKLKFKTGMNSLDAKYGTKGYEQDADQLNLFTAPQNAHGAIKTTFQRAAFERSMVQQERYELRRGNDINDPAVRTVMEARAYMKSKEAILMQDNMLSTAWNGMVAGLERNPRLGKSGKVLAATARAALPIVKVPSNFVGEVASHTPLVGLARPAYELAMSKGIDNLSPEQADIIVTALKKHAVGTALFAIGFFNADKMGGFYAKGGNGMNDVKPNEIRINLFGKELDIPSWLLHSPQMEVMMMGAAFKQAIEQAQNSRSREEKSPVGEALHRTATGLADALPFVDTPKRVLGVMEGTTQAGKEVGNTLGSLTIPGFLPDIASQIDRDPQNHFQTRKRPAKGFGDAMKLSTGVLRGTVPEDSGRRR